MHTQRIPRTLWLTIVVGVLATLILPTAAQPQAAILWQTALGNDDSTAGVTLADGTLFMLQASTLYAFDAATGVLKWNVTDSPGDRKAKDSDGDGLLSTPVVADGIVLAIMDQVTAWNATSGAYLWTSNQPTLPYGEAVSVDLNTRTVFVGVQPSEDFPAPLVALSLDTGSLQWQGVASNLTDVGNGMGPAVIAPDAGSACVFTSGGYVICYNISNGAVAWGRCPTGSGTNPSAPCPAVFGGTLYYGCGMLVVTNREGGGGYAISNGNEQWSWRGRPSQLAVVSNCMMYAATAEYGPGISARGMGDGAVQWSTPIAGNYSAYPIIADGNMLVATNTGVYMASMATGAITFNASLPQSVGYPAPQVQYAGERMFLASSETVYAVSTGAIVNISICLDSACQQCPDNIQVLANQCLLTADGGSITRQCSGSEVAVSTYTHILGCTAGQAPQTSAKYALGQCIPSIAGVYMMFDSCGPPM
jgi:outer membrane protein assembly factor BamB